MSTFIYQGKSKRDKHLAIVNLIESDPIFDRQVVSLKINNYVAEMIVAIVRVIIVVVVIVIVYNR